jgi:hypothetical protein
MNGGFTVFDEPPVKEVLKRLNTAQVEAQRNRYPDDEDEPRSALEYVQGVYKGRRTPDPRRLQAARDALQFEVPRLGVIATTNLNGADFAALLDKAIARANGVRVEPKALPPPAPSGEEKGPA